MASELDRIIKDWSQRQKAIRAMRYVAEGDTTEAKGLCSEALLPLGPELAARAPKGDIPAQDYTYAERVAVVLDFDRNLARKEKTWQEYTYVSFEYVPKHRVWLSDGRETQVYEPRDAQVAAGHVPGTYDPELILSHTTFDDVFFETSDLAAFFAAAIFPTPRRMVTPKQMRLPLDPQSLQIQGTAVLEGRVHQVLKTASSPSDPRKYVELWVDPERASIVSRWISHGGQKVQYDMTYAETSDGWKLTGWKWQWSDNGKPARWSNMRVLEMDINPKLDATLFRVEPVPGMIVQDDRGERRKVVRRGAPGEPDQSIEDLQTIASGNRRRWITMALIGAALIALAIIIAVRARKNRQQPHAP